MNTQEREQLNQLLKPLVEFKLSSKDSEADNLIQAAVQQQPDAAYLLVQRVMLLEHALNSAKARIDELQRQAQSSQAGFLGNDPWAQPAAAPVPGVGAYQQPRYAQPAPAPAQPQAAGGLFGGGSSFLGNVATTAAGVMAGSFLFQGIENMMGHHNGFGGGGFGQQPFGETISEQTIVNNYYGDDAGQQLADNSDFGNDNLISDDSDFGDDSGGDSGWF